MKTTKKTLQGLVARLCTLPGQDPVMFGSPEAISILRNELGRALEAARSDDHATRAVEKIMAEAKWRPTPAEIRVALDGTPEYATAPEPNPKCPICSGSGWQSTNTCDPDCPRCAGRGRVDLDRVDDRPIQTAPCPWANLYAARCSCLRRAAA